MNVACDKCGKAYLLPDGTLQPGVQVRIKCKACQNVFTVTEQLVKAEAANAEPLAEVPDDPNKSPPSDPNAPPGEITKHFIAQSGANKRNPPWKIALFVLGAVGLPTLALFLASTMGVATVKVTNDKGETVEQPFFSSQGVSGLKDLLTGAEAERRARAEQVKAEKARALALAQSGHHGSGGLDEPGRRGDAVGSVAGGDPLKGQGLGAFYNGDATRKDVAPKLKGAEVNTPAAAHAGGLDDAAAAKVVAQSQPAFQSCIENALRRNPSLKVGKVVMTVTIGRSGTVKATHIAPKVHETSDWGTCLAERARRMVFPPFEGDDEADLEVPLVVGVSF